MTLDEFVARYAADFASGDAATVAGHFADPLHVVGETRVDPEVTTADGAQWRRVVDRLLGAYRQLGVTGVRVRSLQPVRLGGGVQLAVVAWTLTRADGSSVYDFEAAYTVVRAGGGLRIAAVAHNETPRLLAALSAHRS